jgi:hypothetical protein
VCDFSGDRSHLPGPHPAARERQPYGIILANTSESDKRKSLFSVRCFLRLTAEGFWGSTLEKSIGGEKCRREKEAGAEQRARSNRK